MTAQQPASRGFRWASWAIGIIGLACLVIGVHAVYFTNRENPDPVLIVVGAVLLMVPLLILRLEAVSLSPNRFELRLVQQIADQGAPKTARLLDHTELGRLVESYGVVRGVLRNAPKEARIQVQDQLVSQAAAFAGLHEFDPGEVRSLFPKAGAPVRALLIGLMLGDPRLLNADVLSSAIHRPASHNEQYQALVVARLYWTRFSVPQQAGLLTAIASAMIPEDSGRRREAEKVLALGRGLSMLRPTWRQLLRRRPI